MTGYGQGAAESDGVRVTVELKGVNHRFLDVKMKLPGEVALLEPGLRAAVQARVSRGRLDISANLVTRRSAPPLVILNRELIGAYLGAVDELKKEFHLKGTPGLETLLALPGALTVQAAPATAEGAETAVLVSEALGQALDAYDAMRTSEGRRLADDISVRLRAVREATRTIEHEARGLPEAYVRRTRERLATLLENGRGLDESRLAQEVALLAGRVDITEEVVRLQGHVDQAEESLARPGGPLGKTLDFIMQEMNREANTISSKAEALPICRAALLIKSEVEKIREQVQNIE